MTQEEKAPLLQARGVSIENAEGVLCHGLELTLTGDSAVWLAQGAPWVELLAGRATLSAGSLLLAGHPVEGGIAAGRVGLALGREVPPASLPVSEWLKAAVLLAGGEERRLGPRVARALESVGLSPLSGSLLQSLYEVERRLLSLAVALLSSPETLVLVGLFTGLDAGASAWLESRVAPHLAGRRWLVVEPPAPPGPARQLLDRAETWVVPGWDGRLTLGRPTELGAPRAFLLRSAEAAPGFVAEVQSAGFHCAPADGETRPAEEAFAWVLVAPAQHPDPGQALLGLAHAHRVPLLELMPLSRLGVG